MNHFCFVDYCSLVVQPWWFYLSILCTLLFVLCFEKLSCAIVRYVTCLCVSGPTHISTWMSISQVGATSFDVKSFLLGESGTHGDMSGTVGPDKHAMGYNVAYDNFLCPFLQCDHLLFFFFFLFSFFFFFLLFSCNSVNSLMLFIHCLTPRSSWTNIMIFMPPCCYSWAQSSFSVTCLRAKEIFLVWLFQFFLGLVELEYQNYICILQVITI